MRVIINSQDEGAGDEIFLGCLIPPPDAPRKELKSDDGTLMTELVESLWNEWREANPRAYSDDEFVTWLVDKKNWTVCEEQLFDVTVQW